MFVRAQEDALGFIITATPAEIQIKAGYAKIGAGCALLQLSIRDLHPPAFHRRKDQSAD
jgi:hypothetical protein